MRYVIGFLLMLGLCISLFGVSSVVLAINMPAIAAFMVVTVAIIIMRGEFKVFIAAVNALLSKKYVISATDQEKAIKLFKLLSKSMTGTAVLCVACGFILMFSYTNWETMPFITLSQLSFGFGITLIAVFYGAFINLVFYNPAISMLESRHNAEVKTVISEKQVIDKLLELSYKQGITPEEILEANEIAFRKKH